MGRRSAGGVVIIERSRMPTKAISRVRGIGLALRVKTSTPIERALIASLCVTPKRCSSVHDEESEVLEADVLRQQSVRADDDVDAAVFQAGQRLFGLGVGRRSD